jgi:hypothetical protein
VCQPFREKQLVWELPGLDSSNLAIVRGESMPRLWISAWCKCNGVTTVIAAIGDFDHYQPFGAGRKIQCNSHTGDPILGPIPRNGQVSRGSLCTVDQTRSAIRVAVIQNLASFRHSANIFDEHAVSTDTPLSDLRSFASLSTSIIVSLICKESASNEISETCRGNGESLKVTRVTG